MNGPHRPVDASRVAAAQADAARPPAGRYLVWEYLVRCRRRYLLSSLAEAVPALLVAAAVQIGMGESSYPAYSRFKGPGSSEV